jgi:septum formation protein
MNWLDKYNVILGSGSPRRVQLMQESGYQFTQYVIEVDESFDPSMATELVAEHLAIKKSQAHTPNQQDLIITADSIVVINNTILGKPKDANQATEYLNMLSNTSHLVHTGVCIRSTEKMKSFTATSEVWMRKLTDDEIEHYVTHYAPYDRAGSYGIQDWLGHNCVEKIVGSYTNIMGLPTARLYQELQAFVG